jgi:uncharacterized membrane protein YukC
MEELKIHSQGRNEHLISIIDKYNKLKNSLKRNTKLTEEEKQTELKKIEEQFEKEKKNSKQNLY